MLFRRDGPPSSNHHHSIGMTRVAGELVAIPHPVPKSGFKAAPPGQARAFVPLAAPLLRRHRAGWRPSAHVRATHPLAHDCPTPRPRSFLSSAPRQRVQRDHVSAWARPARAARAPRSTASHATPLLLMTGALPSRMNPQTTNQTTQTRPCFRSTNNEFIRLVRAAADSTDVHHKRLMPYRCWAPRNRPREMVRRG